MKTKLLLSIIFLTVTNLLFAQSSFINYKAIISEDGNILTNAPVTIKFSIIEDATVKYVESHSVTTDDNGIAIANIGNGTEITGTYADVVWSNENHFLKTEVDSGSGFIDMGTTEFHAVPYAISGGSVKSLNDLSDAITVQASTYIGYAAGASEGNTGLWNVGIGKEALKNMTNRNFNTAIGSQSMSNLTGGSENTAIGMMTLYYNKDGANNTSLGSRSGFNTKGSNNIFIGYNAGHNEVGSNKLYIESSDSDTPLIGGDFSTDEVVINGTLQVTGGEPAAGKILTSDATGKASWEIAAESGASEINDLSDAKYDGSSLFIGTDSGGNDDGDNGNTAIGYATIRNNTSGEHNTVVGKYAGLNSSGSNNVIIGYSAGYSMGSGNIIIGNEAYKNWAGDNNILAIDNYSTDKPLLGGDFESNEIVINGTLQVTGGSPSAGKVLTSDADGKATWETVSVPVKTETIAYSSFNIQPSDSNSNFERYFGYFIPSAGSDQYNIPINLPIGSKIMSMKVYYYDFSNDADITVNIYKAVESASSVGNWGGITTSGYSTNVENLTQTYGYSAHVIEGGAVYIIQIRSVNGDWAGTRATSITSIELTYEK